MSSGEQNQKNGGAKPKALLVRAAPSSALEKLQTILQKLSELEVVEGEDWASQAEERIVFLDASLAASAGEIPAILVGASPASWKGSVLRDLPSQDLARAVQLALTPEKKPGITCLSDSSAAIFYEKVHHVAEIGAKVDHFLRLIEKCQSPLLPKLFHLRQLSYSIFHQAFLAAPEILVPTVDFQVTAGESRIVFAARFSAREETMAEWREALSSGQDPLSAAAFASADLLAITELREPRQIELKALIANEGKKEASLLFASIDHFLPAAAEQEARKAAQIQPLGSQASAQGGEPGAAAPEGGEQAVAMGLNYKVRSEMLENENANLQGLVKKKNHLITELNRDVNRAQRELVLAKNNQNKELQKMRMELEKEKNESRNFQEEIARIRRRQEEEKSGAAPAQAQENPAEPARDWEKEFKAADYAKRLAEEKMAELTKKSALQEEMIQNLRKEAVAAAGEINDLKDKIFRLSQMANSRKAQEAQNSGAQTATAAQIALAEKLKEAQRQQLQAKSKEQELEKEIKRLKLQLDAAEKNMRAKVALLEKAVESKDKQLEEAKRQKADALKKAEEGKKAG